MKRLGYSLNGFQVDRLVERYFWQRSFLAAAAGMIKKEQSIS